MKHGETLPCGHPLDLQADDWPTISGALNDAVARHERCPTAPAAAPGGASLGFTSVRPQFDHDTTRTGGTRA